MPSNRVALYVDGFNVYFRLKGTPYKWLDYQSLGQSFLRPNQRLTVFKYFTARINGRFDSDAPTRQDAYLRALRAHIPEIEIFEGSFLVTTKTMRRADNPAQSVNVLAPEEKGSDVNLAVHLLNDAWKGAYDMAYVMSNDSDLAEAIRLVRHECQKPVGVIVPGKKDATARLKAVANPVLICRIGRMAHHQLPNPIPGTSIHKPNSW